jgi:MFS family permease
MGEAHGLPRPFRRYWAAAAISAFGTAVTAVALPVLVVQHPGATPLEVGVVSAAQFVPYAVPVLSLVGALSAGIAVGSFGDRPTLLAVAIVFAGAATMVGLSSVRAAHL